jgi:hypothetical protein
MMSLRRRSVVTLLVMATLLFAGAPVRAAAPGVGNVPQGTQSNTHYASSYADNGVTNVSATTQKTSCYTPEVPYFTNIGPAGGHSGMSACAGAANTGEDLGPYAT